MMAVLCARSLFAVPNLFSPLPRNKSRSCVVAVPSTAFQGLIVKQRHVYSDHPSPKLRRRSILVPCGRRVIRRKRYPFQRSTVPVISCLPEQCARHVLMPWPLVRHKARGVVALALPAPFVPVMRFQSVVPRPRRATSHTAASPLLTPSSRRAVAALVMTRPRLPRPQRFRVAACLNTPGP